MNNPTYYIITLKTHRGVETYRASPENVGKLLMQMVTDINQDGTVFNIEDKYD